MPDTESFQDRLEAALEQREKFFDQKTFPDLKESLRLFQTIFESIYNILLRKSLIHEDPYKYEQKISEVTVPSKEEFLESEKQERLSQRLSELHSQIDFLNNYYQFSVDFLTLDRIKRIVELVKYINWQRLAETSSNIMTSTLAEALGKIKLGSDSLSIGIINDSMAQIAVNEKKILAFLNELGFFLREKYKLELRQEVISNISDPHDSPETINEVKKIFKQHMEGKPYYPQLVQEVLSEDFSDLKVELQTQVLKKLAVPREKPKVKKEEKNYKAILLEAVRLLVPANGHIIDAYKKIQDNMMILQGRKQSLGIKFRKWMEKVSQKGSDAQIIVIEYFDTATSTTLTEKLNYQVFSEKIQKKGRVFNALANKLSPSFQRLEKATEDQIFDFLNKNIGEFNLIHRQMGGLITYLKGEVLKEQRSRIKGINIELSGLKNSIIKANKKKHEYVAVKEEEQQMKKLGIKMD